MQIHRKWTYPLYGDHSKHKTMFILIKIFNIMIENWDLFVLCQRNWPFLVMSFRNYFKYLGFTVIKVEILSMRQKTAINFQIVKDINGIIASTILILISLRLWQNISGDSQVMAPRRKKTNQHKRKNKTKCFKRLGTQMTSQIQI